MKKHRVRPPSRLTADEFAKSIGVKLESEREYVCEWCGKKYTPLRRRKDGRFCKPSCRMASYSSHNVTVPVKFVIEAVKFLALHGAMEIADNLKSALPPNVSDALDLGGIDVTAKECNQVGGWIEIPDNSEPSHSGCLEEELIEMD